MFVYTFWTCWFLPFNLFKLAWCLFSYLYFYGQSFLLCGRVSYCNSSFEQTYSSLLAIKI
ncbi:unnamed protein product [Meloidogyne enterolobii]|uniref:Uncharacterized protein n=1 Tax=Meloidogyne enterolobii TaxID=390850 RepID=A0ACB1B7V7_MELEN